MRRQGPAVIVYAVGCLLSQNRFTRNGVNNMYWVEFYCPMRPAEGWKRSEKPYDDLDEAIGWAQVLKPPQGSCRVMSKYGNLMYQR